MSDDILNSIHEKVEKIAEDISEIKLNQAVMQLDVKHHIKRSDALEDLVTHLDEAKIQPLQNDVSKIKGAYQLLVILGIIASIAIVFVEWFKK